MSFWDSSALIAVLVPQAGSDGLEEILRHEEPPSVWWGTSVECISAIARLKRSGSLNPLGATAAIGRLRNLETKWLEIEPSLSLRNRARELLEVHPLRAADALQLAAALAAAEDDPAGFDFVCLDQRLCDAARREGFPILP